MYQTSDINVPLLEVQVLLKSHKTAISKTHLFFLTNQFIRICKTQVDNDVNIEPFCLLHPLDIFAGMVKST